MYPGINAHLNSFLQSPDGGWESFHAACIETLTSLLDATLPENYYVLSEKSLQVATTTDDLHDVRRTIPDVSVFKERPGASTQTSTTPQPTMTLPITQTLPDDEQDLRGTVIYHMESGKYPGRPVTRLEVLSPANKPGGSHALTYQVRRRETLSSGLNLIEIDWLHETRPEIASLPSYPDREPGAYPYWLIVSSPHPSLEDGKTDIYGTSVDHPLPTIPLPLSDGDTINLDFNAVYQNTADSRRAFRLVVDYASDPVNVDQYTEADQARIRALMQSSD